MPSQAFGPVTLAIGPAGSGKTAAALTEYGAALVQSGTPAGTAPAPKAPANPSTNLTPKSPSPGGSGAARLGAAAGPCLWIAPTRTAASAVREALADRGPALLGPGVNTFGGLAAEIVRDAGLLLTPINALQRRRLLRRLIDQAMGEAGADRGLQYYGPVAATPGLATIVDDAIAQFQRRGMAPDELAPRAEGAEENDTQARDLALLYARYSEQLAAAGLIDAETLLIAAADALAAARLKAPDFDLIVIDGFASFTALELRLLKELARRTRRLHITLPGDSDGRRSDLFAAPLRTASVFSRAEIITHAAPQSEGSAGAASYANAWPALAHLERNLFRLHSEVEPPAPAVVASLDRMQVIAASGVQAEVVEIARRVKQLLVAGVAPGDVVVAFRSTRDAAERVRQTFDDFGIPTHIDATRRLSASALVRTLLGVLRLAAEDWPYRRVLQAVGDSSLGIFDAGAGADADVRQASERCVRYAQLPSGRRALFGQLAAWAADAERTSRPTPADAALAGEGLGRLAALVDVLPRRASIDRWVVALGALANDLGLLHPATDETAANWSILARALRSAGRIDAATQNADAKFNLAEIIEIITSCAAQTSATQSNDATGRVRVLGAEAARLTRPRHLFVAGLSEQSFPAAHRASVMSGEDDAAETRSAEMLLFYQLVTRPRESLTLSYPALDERAQTLPRSPFLVELERAFAPVELPRVEQPLNYARHVIDDGETPLSRSELRRGAVGRALGRKPDRNMLATLAAEVPMQAPGSAGGLPSFGAGVRGVARTESTGGAGGSYANIGQAILAGIDAVADRSRRDAFGPFEGMIASPATMAALTAAYGADHLWSPSRLESYAECPFLFFGQQLLHLEATPELALASDVRRRGSLLHETLARLYDELRGETPEPEQLAAIVAERFHASLAAVAATRPGRGVDAAIREIERRQIAAWAADFALQDAKYRAHWQNLDQPPQPTYFEARFGPASKHSDSRGDATLSTDEPFRLTVPIAGRDEPVQFAGQIDRIDVGRVGDQVVFNIIDYKTSAQATVRSEEIHAGRQIQLPLYALAVEQQLLAAEEAAALTAGFWSIRGKGFVGSARSGGPLNIREVRDGALVAAPAWDGSRTKLVARIGEIIAHIRQGYFPVASADEHCTEHCDLRTICRIAQVRSLDKIWSPPVDAVGGPHAKAQRREEEGGEER